MKRKSGTGRERKKIKYQEGVRERRYIKKERREWVNSEVKEK